MENSAQKEYVRIAVIGGGAAGLAAAVAAGRQARARGVDVQINLYELDQKTGKPILRSGNGRCNFSNTHISPQAYTQDPSGQDDEHSRFVAEAFEQLSPNDVHKFFSLLGLEWAEEGQGRLYPSTFKASSVLDVLRKAARAYGVQELCDHKVSQLEPPRAEGLPWTLRMDDGAFHRAEAVICALGSHDGLTCLPPDLPTIPFRPVLGPLRTDTRYIKALDNIRVKADVRLIDSDGKLRASEQGEVLFRKYGVSGIAVFNLSRFAQAGDTLSINLLPGKMDLEGLVRQRIANCLTINNHARTSDIFDGLLLPLVAQAVCKKAKIDIAKEASLLTEDEIQGIAHTLEHFDLAIEGIGDPSLCQVNRGGIKLAAIDPHSMQTHDYPGLFLVGELLDIDAPCGGYNLHWAWTSGIIAGERAVKLIC